MIRFNIYYRKKLVNFTHTHHPYLHIGKVDLADHVDKVEDLAGDEDEEELAVASSAHADRKKRGNYLSCTRSRKRK